MTEPVLQALDYFGIAADLTRGQARIICPFHADLNPSLDLELTRGYWNCLGCGAHGDFVDFVGRLQSKNGHVNRMKAIMLIQELQKRPAPDLEALGFRRKYRRRDPTDAAFGWRRFQTVNWSVIKVVRDPVARYLIERRGFRRDTLEAFDVRLTDDPDYPFVIPIRQGDQMVGWVARRIDNVEKRKYRYNVGFPAGETVAYYRHGKAAPCLIVEGILDLMRAAEYDYRHAAAILSWRLHDKQVERLKTLGVRDVICGLDNTPLGREGCQRLAKHFKVRRFMYPSHRKDVGECARDEFLRGIVLAR